MKTTRRFKWNLNAIWKTIQKVCQAMLITQERAQLSLHFILYYVDILKTLKEMKEKNLKKSLPKTNSYELLSISWDTSKWIPLSLICIMYCNYRRQQIMQNTHVTNEDSQISKKSLTLKIYVWDSKVKPGLRWSEVNKIITKLRLQFKSSAHLV